MPSEASPEAWAAPILRLADDRAMLAGLSVGARAFAERHLGLPRFRQRVRRAVQEASGAIAGDVVGAGAPPPARSVVSVDPG